MTFMTIQFLLFLAVLLLIFYLVPVACRWVVLLVGSLLFYFVTCGEAFPILLITVLFSYLMSRAIYATINTSKAIRISILVFSIVLIVCPLFAIKEGNYILTHLNLSEISFIVPLGISFYTLQIIAYFVDIYRGKITPEKNIFRYALYITYFPQIIQGPIPRFDQLGEQLKVKFKLNEEAFIKGFQLILWGWFLKLVIADKAGVIVDTVFSSPDMYRGMYVLVAGILYSIQLYTDFMACVYIARGTSQLFGIRLEHNFKRPYFSQSNSEFWRRWHISLSNWLRDYIYIPLGGNRKGTIRKYINIIIVFFISGMWHGAGLKYIFWGLSHAAYQIIGALLKPVRGFACQLFRLKSNDKLLVVLRTLFTFFCVMLAWVIFRADSLSQGLDMVGSIFTVFNPWILFDDSLLSLGLDWKEIFVLVAALFLLFWVSRYQEKRGSLADRVLAQNVVTRVLIYLCVIVIIFLFGTYGFGFDPKDFIYGGF